jgi:UDP-2,3-diacylglucosamine hydrolase
MHECYFVSDLHLMASRSAARRHLGAIERAARRAKTFVLGGDIFDFRWARTSNTTQAVDQAIGWLEELLADCPACDFHFVLGNHDYHQPFIDRLDKLQRRVGNLSWHRYYVRLGTSIFLHGDVADRKMSAQKLAAARSRWLHHKRRGRVLSRLYDLVVLARLHKPLPRLVYPKRTVARRILAYLDDIGQGPASGVRNVYFGHIHRNLTGYRYGGVMFYNGGAPIKGLKFRIVEANIVNER